MYFFRQGFNFFYAKQGYMHMYVYMNKITHNQLTFFLFQKEKKYDFSLLYLNFFFYILFNNFLFHLFEIIKLNCM